MGQFSLFPRRNTSPATNWWATLKTNWQKAAPSCLKKKKGVRLSLYENVAYQSCVTLLGVFFFRLKKLLWTLPCSWGFGDAYEKCTFILSFCACEGGCFL